MILMTEKGKMQNQLFVPVLGGTIVAFIITMLLLLFTINYGSSFDLKIQVVACALFACWFLILLTKWSQFRQYKKIELFGMLLLFLVMAIYMANTVWNMGYLTSDIYEAMVSGTINADTLYHETLAQAIKNNGYPSILIGSAEFINYHCFSHYLLALLSRMTGVSVPFVYNYLYPVVFFPIYIFLLLSVVQKLRTYFKINAKISFWDIIALLCFVIGYLPAQWADGMALWRGSWIFSESFFIGQIIVLFYLFLLLTVNERGWFERKVCKIIFLFLINPLFIVMSYFAKISLGVLLLAAIMFFFFSTHMKDIKYWIVNCFYFLIFILLWFVPGMIDTPIQTITEVMRFSVLDFMRTYVPLKFWATHIFFLFLFTMIVVAFRYRNETSLKNAVFSNEYLPERILIVVSILGILPGIIMKISGGSAAYFSYVQMLPAIILLIAYNIPNTFVRAMNKKFVSKIILGILSVCLCFSFVSNATRWDLYTSDNSFTGLLKKRFVSSSSYTPNSKNDIKNLLMDGKFITATQKFIHIYFDKSKYANDNFVQVVEYINDISKDDKDNYYIFADNTAEVWSRYTSTRNAFLYFYPANTGIVMIGALYKEDGIVRYGNDATGYSNDWNSARSNDRLSVRSAIKMAKIDEKDYLIYLFDDQMRVYDLRPK